MQNAGPLGIASSSYDLKPKQIIEEFYKRDPEGNIDRIYAKVIKDAPQIKLAQAKLLEAQSDLDQAELNLSYCDVCAEIDGVVTRRNVNPGNNVIVGPKPDGSPLVDGDLDRRQFQGDATCRSANRAGGGLDVDMYGSRQTLQGPHLRVHDGNRFDAGAAAGRECDREFREGRAAAAGPNRTGGLRSRTRRRCSSACR